MTSEKRKKSAVIQFRTRPQIRTILERVADDTGLTISTISENAVIRYLMDTGYLVARETETGKVLYSGEPETRNEPFYSNARFEDGDPPATESRVEPEAGAPSKSDYHHGSRVVDHSGARARKK